MSLDAVRALRTMKRRERRLAAGEHLFNAGDTVTAMYVVARGRVALVRHGPQGETLVLQRARAGEVLAEASLFASRYHCDAHALAPSVVEIIDREEWRAFLRRDPDLAEAWAAHLARRVQEARLRGEILTLRKVGARLDAWLAAAGGDFPPRGEWREVAAQIGVSPEAFYRELARRRRARSAAGAR